jgi:hypothetical protein
MPPKPAASPPADGLGFSPTLLYSLVFSSIKSLNEANGNSARFCRPSRQFPGYNRDNKILAQKHKLRS